LKANDVDYYESLNKKYGIDFKNAQTLAAAKLELQKSSEGVRVVARYEYAKEELGNETGTAGDRVKRKKEYDLAKSAYLQYGEDLSNLSNVDLELQNYMDTVSTRSPLGSGASDFSSEYTGMSSAIRVLTMQLDKLKRAYENLDELDTLERIANLKLQSEKTKELAAQLKTEAKAAFEDSGLDGFSGMSFEKLFNFDKDGEFLEVAVGDSVKKFYEDVTQEIINLGDATNEASKDQKALFEEGIAAMDTYKVAALGLQSDLKASTEATNGAIQTQIDLSRDAEAGLASAQLQLDKDRLEAVNELTESVEDLIKFEKEGLKDVIKAKKEQLQIDKETLDYQKQLGEEQESVAKLEARLSLISRDTSQAGVAKRLEAEQALSDAKEALAETEADHQISVTEDLLDEETEAIDAYLSESGTLTADAMKRIADDFKDGFGVLKGELLDWNKTYGTSLDEDITDSWDVALTAFERYRSALEESGLNGVTDALNSSIEAQESARDGDTINFDTPDDAVQVMKDNSALWGGADEVQRKELADSSLGLGHLLERMFKDELPNLERGSDGVWRFGADPSNLDKELFKEYRDGGVSTGTQTAVLHGTVNDPEWIFNNDQLKATIANIVTESRRIPNRRSFGVGKQDLSSAGPTGDVSLSFKDMINIQGSADANTVAQLKGATTDIVDAVLTKITDSFGLKGQYKLKSN